MVEKPNKFQAALTVGIIFGVLSAIPFVNLLNICCCLLFVAAGALAAKSLINRSPVFPVNSGDGAAVGALAGMICAGVELVVGLPIALLTSEFITPIMMNIFKSFITDPRMLEEMEKSMSQQQGQPLAAQIGAQLVFWLILAAVGTGMATLGGVIGVAMFEKRKGQPPPQPPSGYPPPPQQPGGYPPPPSNQ
ncbi:MAG TPA: hypothetical protein VG778_01350 [Blastocatellia bacterium]|nr:hypothetical protein [Blastocatellia bacterium]